jgi:hypothetical protein
VLFCLGLHRDARVKQGAHRTSVTDNFGPYKQGARNFKPEIIGRVKEEMDQLLHAGFIQPCRYAY